MPHNVSVVSRSAAFPLKLSDVADVSTVLRVLWLEGSPGKASSSPKSRASTVGPLKAIGCQYIGMSARMQNLVSLGEFRNFLWNLHLDDSNFSVVSKRFAPTGDYIDYEENSRHHISNRGPSGSILRWGNGVLDASWCHKKATKSCCCQWP